MLHCILKKKPIENLFLKENLFCVPRKNDFSFFSRKIQSILQLTDIIPAHETNQLIGWGDWPMSLLVSTQLSWQQQTPLDEDTEAVISAS